MYSKYNEAITKWLENEKNNLRPYYESLDWKGEDLEEVIKNESDKLDKFVSTIYDAVNLKNREILLKLYIYFENLSNNRNIAFLFKELTGINPGRTNKEGIKAFNEFFGYEIEAEINKRRNEAKETEKALQEQEEKKKKDEVKEYFKNPIWNVSNLTPQQLGKLKKMLEEEFNFTTEGIKSLKSFIEGKVLKDKHVNNNMYKWNRKKFNNMDGEEQREYENKLLKGRNYNISYDNCSFEINKTIFDALDLQDTTDYEQLKIA